MKKLFLLCFTLIIIIPLFAKAETNNSTGIIIESITRDITSDVSIEKSEPIIEGSKVNLNLDFNEEGSFIKYILVIKNNSKNDFVLNKELVNFNTNYINYDIKSVDESDTIKVGESKNLILTIKYIKEVDDTKYENGVLNDAKTISFDLIGVERNIPNPDTGVNNPLIRLIILLVIVGSLYLLLKRKSFKKYMIWLLLLMIPISINAISKFNISINSNVTILKTNYLYTTSTNDYYIGDTINSGDPLYNKYNLALNGFNQNFFIRHLIDSNNKITSSYIGFMKDDNIYYIQGGNNGNYYQTNKDELLKIFGKDNCTGVVNDYICTDSNLDLEVIVSNDGFVEIGDSTWTCNIEGNNRSYCSAKK